MTAAAVLDRPDIAAVVRARYDGRMETTRQIADELGIGPYAVLDWARDHGLANAQQPDDITDLKQAYGAAAGLPAYSPPNVIPNPGASNTRECLGCGRTLPLSAFGRAGRGLSRTCRACSRKAAPQPPADAPAQPDAAAAAEETASDRYALLAALLRRLPPDGHWSHERRRQTWAEAFTALLYELTDAPDGEVSSKHE